MNSLVIAERDADNFEVIFVGNLADGEFCMYILLTDISEARLSCGTGTTSYDLYEGVERREKPFNRCCDNNKSFKGL